MQTAPYTLYGHWAQPRQRVGPRVRSAATRAPSGSNTNRGFPRWESLYRADRAANSQITSACLTRHLTLKCHSIEGGTRFHIRKTLTTWSPLTESNRRPSPYHGSLCSSAASGRLADLCEHEHTLALTSAGRAHASAICHSILPLTLILRMNHHMRSSIFSSMTGRYAFTVSVRGLRPQIVYGRHAMLCGAGRVTRRRRSWTG